VSAGRTSGPATVEDLQELHRLLVASVEAALREPRPSVELLSVTRRVIHDSNAPVELTGRDKATLRRLHRLYLRKLYEAIVEGPPSAAVLAEVRLTLATAPLEDLADDLKARDAALLLVKAGLPFVSK
jgi:hypothetical protein